MIEALFKVDSQEDSNDKSNDENTTEIVSMPQAIQRFKRRRQVKVSAKSKCCSLLPERCLQNDEHKKMKRILRKGIERYENYLDIRSLINLRWIVSSLVNILLSDSERRLLLLRRKGQVINPSSQDESSFDEELNKDYKIARSWFLTLKKENLKLYKSDISRRLYQSVLFSNKPTNFTEVDGTLAYFRNYNSEGYQKETKRLLDKKGKLMSQDEKEEEMPKQESKIKSTATARLPFISAILSMTSQEKTIQK